MALSERAGFWTAASVAGLALWASGAPSVVYPLYAEEWQLQPSVTTAIFAIYPIVLVPVLIVFGNLSDVIGRRAVILMGLGALTAGSDRVRPRARPHLGVHRTRAHGRRASGSR